jgi:hypothetical protein
VVEREASSGGRAMAVGGKGAGGGIELRAKGRGGEGGIWLRDVGSRRDRAANREEGRAVFGGGEGGI